MAILVTCPCGQQFETRDENAGRRARCPDCGSELIVPKPGQLPDDDFVGLSPADASSGGTSGKAIASLVLGILSFFCTIFTGIPAIIFGCLGLSDINKSRGRLKGGWMAIVGIICGGLGSTLVLIALLLPAVQAAREAARRAQCVNNMKQMGLAMHNFASANNRFPGNAITDKEGRPLLSWRVAILPYIEEQALYNEFHLDEPWDSPHNRALIPRMPKAYQCPSRPPQEGKTSYKGINGPNALMGTPRGVKIQDITDGTSNTILVVESSNPVTWTSPEDEPFNLGMPATGLGSNHPGGFNTLFADGSVRFLKNVINPATLRALFTYDGGEVVSASSY